MARTVKSPESTCLLDDTTNTDVSAAVLQRSNCCPSLQHVCIPSKAAILILLWTAIVGIMYYLIFEFSAGHLLIDPHSHLLSNLQDALSYAILAFIMMFYPLSGFIADVCCGRLKTVVVSLVFLLFSYISALLCWFVLANIEHHLSLNHISLQRILVSTFGTIAVISFIVGIVGYQANFIQLGLDHLFEAPSRYLGLFIHYAVWTFQLGSLLLILILPIMLCLGKMEKNIVFAPPITTFTLFYIVLLCVSIWKRRWFYSEPGRDNPYKTVYDVIRFVKNHKHPLQRSAFTYSDNYIPSRLDFAKERYGGPFSTEQVENVKTFFRILLVLFAVGPVFSMEVLESSFLFPVIGAHILKHVIIIEHSCPRHHVLKLILEIGGVKNITSTMILFPVYIWMVFYLLRKKVPKLFLRLGVGIVICLLGVVSLLIVDILGHSVNRGADTNQTQCMFHMSLTHNSTVLTYPALNNIHWAVLIPPNLFLGIGVLIVIATTLEFISAQSPQSMKGLLVGVFFAIRGLFQFLNTIIIIPLSLKKPWASREMIEHPPVINCGFVYLLVTSVTGLIGLILFSVAAKRYKYRRRDEGWFSQHDVEEIYDRYLPQAAVDDSSSDNTD